MNDKPKILIVEDERHIARLLKLALEKENFQTATESNGRRAYERIVQEKFDMVLLDIMLPEMNGMEICRRVREISDIPIIMLTAKDAVEDKVHGLELGANDYMTKPFATEELLARMRGIFKRLAGEPRPEETRLIAGNVIIYPERYEVRFQNNSIELTHKEYELLYYFMANKGKVLTRDQILQKVWGYDYGGDTNVVDVYVSYLRSKIDHRFEEKHLHTIRGVGYVLRD